MDGRGCFGTIKAEATVEDSSNGHFTGLGCLILPDQWVAQP